jgi:anthraniloyl-CoA monooxygenase
MSNAKHLRGSAWMNFPRVLCEKWYHENVVLMGDAAATGAFLDRVGLQAGLRQRHRAGRFPAFRADMEKAFERYQEERRLEVLRLQSAARNSLEWFEEVERYLDLDPVQFNYSLLTRSQRISHENLRLRDPNGWKAPSAGSRRRPGANGAPPRADVRALPAARHGAEEPRRRLADGAVQGRGRLPDRLAPRPLRRTRQGRRRAGLYRDDLRRRKAGSRRAAPGSMRPSTRRPGGGWSISSMPRPTRRSAARSAIPAARARPSSAGRRWTRRCRRQLADCWISASAIPWSDAQRRAARDGPRRHGHGPRPVRRRGEMAARAGFDMIELHAAHGYLISPSSRRCRTSATDDYGGQPGKPDALSAGGVRRDARGLARGQADVGAHLGQRLGRRRGRDAGRGGRDRPRCSRGRRRHHRRLGRPDLDRGAKPVYGRMFQTPFLRPHPQRGRASRPWRSATSTRPITSTRS